MTDTNSHSRETWPLWLAMTLALIWVPSLDRGFCEDDFLLVPITLTHVLENPCGALEHLPQCVKGFRRTEAKVAPYRR